MMCGSHLGSPEWSEFSFNEQQLCVITCTFEVKQEDSKIIIYYNSDFKAL